MPAVFAPDEAATTKIASEFSRLLMPGVVVLLVGELGAGKTTFVRGVLEGLGWNGAVRSPTFNLIQTFPVEPPVMHADLYRLETVEGTGLSEYFESHACLIEWAERLPDELRAAADYTIRFEFCDGGRTIEIQKENRLEPKRS